MIDILDFDVNEDYKHLLDQSPDGVIVVRDMPNAVYHSQNWSLSSSGAKHLLENPADFFYHCWDHEFPAPQTEPLIFGSVVHTALSEPHKLEKEVRIMPDHFLNFKGNFVKTTGTSEEAQEYRENFFAENKGFYCITNENFEKVQKIKRQSEKNDFFQMLMNEPSTEIELSIFWKQEVYKENSTFEPMTNIEGKPITVYCRCRPDILCMSKQVNCDIKTLGMKAGEKLSEAFAKRIDTASYYMSAGHYAYGINKAFGFKPKTVFYVVTKTEPFSQAAFQLNIIGPSFWAGENEARKAYKKMYESIVKSFFTPVPIEMNYWSLKNKGDK